MGNEAWLSVVGRRPPLFLGQLVKSFTPCEYSNIPSNDATHSRPINQWVHCGMVNEMNLLDQTTGQAAITFNLCFFAIVTKWIME